MSGETVKSMGDSWVICRSKTYSGRIYYFNTLNGNAVWNLSEPEIEKAKKMTEGMNNQPDFFNYNCPEPAESPQDYQIVQSTSTEEQPSCKINPSNVYNKQVINNRFPKHNINQFTPYNQLPPVQLNIPVTSFYSGIGSNTAQPMFVIPANVSQSNPLMNTFDYIPSKTLIPLSQRFKTLSEENTNSNILRKNKFYSNSNINTYTKNRNTYRFSKKYYGKNNNPAHINDLRLLLKSKRRGITSKETEGEQYEENPDYSLHVPHKLRSNVINDNEDDDYWTERNMLNQVSIEAINTLKKNILKVNDFDTWYIVTDSNVFLNNVNFIDFIMKSDTHCRLLIPQIVMNKLQNATNSRLRTLAHKAAYFISKKVDNNNAIIDKDVINENVDYKDAILNCCLKWIAQEKRVMLLTDDIELHSCEIRIPVYTVFELKKMLTYSPPNVIIPKGPENLSPKLNRSIKITIQNQNNTCDSMMNLKQTESSVPDAYSAEDNDVFSQAEVLPSDCSERKNEYLKKCSNELNLSIEKNIDDDSVQTDSTELNMREENSDTDTFQSDRNENNCNTKFNKTKSVSLKRRSPLEIALKLNNDAKKPFKWPKQQAKTSLSMISENTAIDNGQVTNDIRSESVESICDGNIESNNETSSFYRKDSENFSLQKTPTAISNSENSKNIVPERIKYKDVNDDDPVMFTVISQAMENYLKMKCDEWISRFVQIMEEVLTEVLYTDPPYRLDTMPPPWNIYEAVECVKRKFSNINDIIDAATKLSDVLFEIGGLRGKIKAEICPNKYMEMYSYGVYLIDTLQGSLSNVEDLHIAEKSLSKLLHDIQNPHLDASNQDLFSNINTECEKSQIEESVGSASNEAAEPIVDTNNTKLQSEISSPMTRSTKYATSPTGNIYDLRSSKKQKLLQEGKVANEVRFIRNVDLEASFFTSLHLKESLTANVNNKVQNPVVSELTQHNETKNESLFGDNKVNSDPKIIRNFTKCYEFEEKIKKNLQKEDVEQDKWYSDSESHYAVNEELENEDDDFFYENDYDDYEYNDEMYYDDVNESETNNDMQCENNEILKSEQNTNVKFKHVLGNIEDNIKETFSVIHGFCINSYETLRCSDDYMQKLNIQDLAEETLSHVNSLCDALSSILSRETSDCLHKIQELLKMDNLNENVIIDLNVEEYRSFIRKCLEQGMILKDLVKLVIDASKE